MDALKNITGYGSDKPKAEETKPGFIDNTKPKAATGQTPGAATKVVETAKGYGVAGQEAVGRVVTQAHDSLNKPAKPKVEVPVPGTEIGKEAKKEESGNVVGDAAAKVGGLFHKK